MVVPDSDFVYLAKATSDNTNPTGAEAGTGFVICSWNCLNSMDIP